MSQLLSKNTDVYEEFFTSPGLVCLEFFDMETILKVTEPTKNMSQENASMERKKQHIDNMLE